MRWPRGTLSGPEPPRSGFVHDGDRQPAASVALVEEPALAHGNLQRAEVRRAARTVLRLAHARLRAGQVLSFDREWQIGTELERQGERQRRGVDARDRRETLLEALLVRTDFTSEQAIDGDNAQASNFTQGEDAAGSQACEVEQEQSRS